MFLPLVLLPLFPQNTCTAVRLQPLVLIIPLLVCGICIGVGIGLEMKGAQDAEDRQKVGRGGGQRRWGPHVNSHTYSKSATHLTRRWSHGGIKLS